MPDDLAKQLDEAAAAAGGNVSAIVADALRDRIARDTYAARLTAAYGDPDPDAYAYWRTRFTSAPSDDQAQAAPRAS